MPNRDSQPVNRISSYLNFDSIDDLFLPGPDLSCKLLNNLSICNLCRKHPHYEATAYDPDNAESIKRQKNNIIKIFDGYTDDISKLSDSQRREYFIVLVKEVFESAKHFPGIKGFYTDLCIDRFSFHGATPEAIAEAAKCAAEDGLYDDDWHNSKMDLFLYKETKTSEYWCKQRIEYLIEQLSESSQTVDLHKILLSPQFSGVYEYLRENPAELAELSENYIEYLEMHIEDYSNTPRPNVILRALQVLGKTEYLESREFRKVRNTSLNYKFADQIYDDLQSFMAFFERESQDSYSFTSADRRFFSKLKPLASQAILDKITLGNKDAEFVSNPANIQTVRDSVLLACRIFIGDLNSANNRKFAEKFREQIAVGTVSLFSRTDFSVDLPPDIFASLLQGSKFENLADNRELSHFMKVRLFKYVLGYNSVCMDLKEANQVEVIKNPVLYRSQFNKLMGMYLPVIERIEELKNIFGCSFNYNLLSLPAASRQAMSSLYDYVPGKFCSSNMPVNPLYSILSWHNLHSEFHTLLEDGFTREACEIFCRMLKIAETGLAPVSKKQLCQTLPQKHRTSIQMLLGNQFISGENPPIHPYE